MTVSGAIVTALVGCGFITASVVAAIQTNNATALAVIGFATLFYGKLDLFYERFKQLIDKID